MKAGSALETSWAAGSAENKRKMLLVRKLIFYKHCLHINTNKIHDKEVNALHKSLILDICFTALQIFS